ncbi:MAG: hypothetical protein PHH00_03045 [Candidatus Nanoarchaeia archaeon]|nr:hypothetical protein [Candidatus Nanoarchaeia archaeon]
MNPALIEEENFDRARKKIRENRGKEIIFAGSNDETNRKVLEKENINIFLLKQKGRKDRQKQRDSGLDSVLAKFAKKKNVIIGIDYDELMNSEGKEKAEILSRIKQNIKICNKEKLKMKFISNSKNKASRYDLVALGLVLGMSTSTIKDL